MTNHSWSSDLVNIEKKLNVSEFDRRLVFDLQVIVLGC